MASKFDYLKEACETLKSTVSCNCCDLTLLINACEEAARYRTEHHLPKGEKYSEMSGKLRLKSEDLDKRIFAWCDRKLLQHKKKKIATASSF